MRTTIDSAGRIVIPRDIRAAAGLTAGSEVEVQAHDGAVSITPAPARVKIVKRGRVHALAIEGVSETISEADVQHVRDALRNRK